ncbi:MAG: ribose import ATP-binding protein RbsA 1, ribose transport system ATP-binding protein [Armatimonadetes bacterium CSP1-3]|nr:MAG: ribose import ATP-binding protein RbsA 1, ribose transport system ATP-binding protein [Armatimonadetes bacterium CSP1-3]
MSSGAAPPDGIVVRMRQITKIFPGTVAVNRVDLDIRAGEIHGVVGENGAGKSTLMRVLAGLYPDYTGDIEIGGQVVRLTNPRQARELGVALVHQELSLVPELTVADNIFLGREPYARIPGLISRSAAEAQARGLLRDIGIHLNPAAKVDRLSVAERQLVEIAKGVSLNPRVLILDEPTSSLTYQEIRELFRVIRGLAAKGTAIVYISHKLDEVFAVADRVTVLRDGHRVATAPIMEWTEAGLIQAMVGRDLSTLFPRSEVEVRDVRLEVRHLGRRGAFRHISFQVRGGEVVGLYGLIGSGRSEVAEAIYGLTPADEGEILVDGMSVLIRTPRDAISHGIAMTPEDRRLRGLVSMLSLRTNLSLRALRLLSRLGFVDQSRERAEVDRMIHALGIRTVSQTTEVANLSGGTQQKVVIGRWLMVPPKVLILDEPTRGIDVGAKAEVHAIIDGLAGDGLAVLLISSELPEILGMSDRILVMKNGTLGDEFSRREATEERIMAVAAGLTVAGKA